MFPRFALDYGPYSPLANPMLSRQCRLRNAIEYGLANRLGLHVGKFCLAMCFAPRCLFWMSILAIAFATRQLLWVCMAIMLCAYRTPALGIFVAFIVQRRARKQVFRSNARLVVAGVANKWLVFGDGAVGDDVGEAMCSDELHPTVMAEGKPTVSMVGSTRPNPTIARFVNVRPESLKVLCGKLRMHRENSFLVAAPRGVSALPRLSLGNIIAQEGRECRRL